MPSIIGQRIPIQAARAAAPEDNLGGVFQMLAKPFLDPLTPELKRQHIEALDRANINTPIAARATSGGNMQQAIEAALNAGIDPKRITSGNLAIVASRDGATADTTRNAQIAAHEPFTATAQHADDLNTNRLTIQRLQEHGKRMLAEDALTPVVQDGVTRYVRTRDAPGQQASVPLTQVQGGVLAGLVGRPGGVEAATPVQRALIGGEPKNPEVLNATVPGVGVVPAIARQDGLYHAQTGVKLPDNTGAAGRLVAPNADGLSGNGTVDQELLKSRVVHGQLKNAINGLKTELAKPNAGAAVGYVGRGAIAFNDVRAQIEAAARAAGGLPTSTEFAQQELQQALNVAIDTVFPNSSINQKAQQLGVHASVLRSRIQDIAYMQAKVQDPAGRVSVDDVRRAAQTVGASLHDPYAMAQVLDDLGTRADENQRVREEQTVRMFPTVGGQRPGAPTAAPATTNPAPAVAPGAPGGTRMIYDRATGQIQ